jgi:hypothetical protein
MVSRETHWLETARDPPMRPVQLRLSDASVDCQCMGPDDDPTSIPPGAEGLPMLEFISVNLSIRRS